MSNAFVTLLMGASHYVYGAIAMAHSLRKTKTKYDIVCMITPDFQKYIHLFISTIICIVFCLYT